MGQTTFNPIGPNVAFSPVGGSGPVQSPTATEPFLPAVSFYVQEGNTAAIGCAFTDEAGNPVIPTAINWSLSDDEGNIRNYRHDVPFAGTLAQAITIVLNSLDTTRMVFDDLMMILKVAFTYNSLAGNGNGLQGVGQYRFGLIASAVET
jgi:hypothetical protein